MGDLRAAARHRADTELVTTHSNRCRSIRPFRTNEARNGGIHAAILPANGVPSAAPLPRDCRVEAESAILSQRRGSWLGPEIAASPHVPNAVRLQTGNHGGSQCALSDAKAVSLRYDASKLGSGQA